MRRILLPITTVLIFMLTFNGCSETIIIDNGIPVASVQYDFWAGARNVEVDGDIFNDGSTFINAVEIEIALFDEFGHYISSVFQTFQVNLHPRDIFGFSTDIRERNVFDVEVTIHHLE